MSSSFTSRTILRNKSISSVTAHGQMAAFAVETADEEADERTSAIWLCSLAGGTPYVFTSQNDKDPKWSPNGQHIAFLSRRGKNTQVQVIPLSGGEAQEAGHVQGEVSTVAWSPDGSRLAVVATRKVDPENRGARSDKPPDPKSPHIAWRLPYKMNGEGYILSREAHLFIIERATGTVTQLSDGPFDVTGARYSPDGASIAFTRTREGRQAHRTDLWMMEASGANARQLTTDIAAAGNPHWSPDGRWIALSGAKQEGNSIANLWLYDVSSGAAEIVGNASVEVSSGDPSGVSGEDLEVESDESIHWAADSSCFYFVLRRRGVQEIARITMPSGRLEVLVTGDEHVVKMALAEDKLVYTTSSSVAPIELYTSNLEGGDRRKLTSLNSWWDEYTVPRQQRRTFSVPNGQGGNEDIEGWLLLPGKGDGPFPLLVEVHGGPHSIQSLEYGSTPWRQVLCSRGWAVLALNAVGSSSYGRQFARRLRANWGVLDLPQHLAAVESLQNEGITDERIAIFGHSYGGYLAAWSITQTDVFKAAVVAAPVANMESHFGTSDTGYYVTPFDLQGELCESRGTARQLSAVQHLHKARTPTLLLQGEDDQRCPRGQTEEIFATLIRCTEAPAELILYPGETHSIGKKGSLFYGMHYANSLVEWVEKWANTTAGKNKPAAKHKPAQRQRSELETS